MSKENIWRWSFFLLGLMILSLGIALTIKGKDLGIGPWDVFHYGLFIQFGLTIGTWSIIVGCILLLIPTIINKTLPKIGAFVNMLLIGVFIDIFNYIIPNPETYFVQSILFILGVLILGFGIGLYISADLGAGPRDTIMLLIVEKTGWSILWVRNGLEVIVLILGWILSGPVGFGTVIIAFLLGPMVEISLPKCKILLQFCLRRSNLEVPTLKEKL